MKPIGVLAIQGDFEAHGKALERIEGAPRGELEIVDAGCGTGLLAPHLRPYARRLVGVDLSPKMLEKARAMEEGSVNDYNKWANECSVNVDAGSKKVFELLVDDEERHFSQYDLEMEKINKFGEQFLALQSMEGSKAAPAGAPVA